MEDTRIQLAIEHLKSILIEGETLIAVSPQHRLFTIFPFITGGGNNFLFKRRDIYSGVINSMIFVGKMWIMQFFIEEYLLLILKYLNILLQI